jgi:fructokinase
MAESIGTSAGIVVVGDALVDEIHRDGRVDEFVGGAALNVAVGLAELGHEPTLLAMIGDDDDGAAIRRFLDEHRVHLIPTIGSTGSSRAISSRLNGEPFYEFNDAARGRRIAFDSASTDALADAAVVVVSGFPLDDHEQCAALIHAVRDPRARLIIDPNPRAHLIHDGAEFSRALDEVASKCLLLKVGEDDAALLYDSSVAELASRLVESGASAVLATSGENGAAILTATGESVAEPIVDLPSPVRDTMGAGDATLASIVHSIVVDGFPSDELSWRRALRTAMEIAAATCRFDGALLHLP